MKAFKVRSRSWILSPNLQINQELASDHG
jgi:hypothetical protein